MFVGVDHPFLDVMCTMLVLSAGSAAEITKAEAGIDTGTVSPSELDQLEAQALSA